MASYLAPFNNLLPTAAVTHEPTPTPTYTRACESSMKLPPQPFLSLHHQLGSTLKSFTLHWQQAPHPEGVNIVSVCLFVLGWIDLVATVLAASRQKKLKSMRDPSCDRSTGTLSLEH